MTYNYEWKQHQEGLQKALSEQRKSSPHLCDMTLVSKDEQGVESSIAAHKCVLSISSGYLENVINLPDNHNHNLQLDISCMADPTSINQLVDFAYTGKISFTAVDFDRLATAIEKLQIRNIDEVSINKIREDINLSNSKKASSETEPSISPTSPQPTAPRMQQIMLSPSHMTHSTHSQSHPKVIPFGIVPLEPATTGVSTVGQAKKGRPIVPKIEGLPHQLIGNNIQVLIQDPMMSIPKIDYIKDDRGDPALEETDNLLSLLKMNYDEVANCARAQLETAIERLKLTNSQRAAIWEVRRKSKNRIAAARCRKRKIEDMKENDETIEQLRTIFETKQNQNWELRATLEQILVDISAKTEDANNENLDSEQKSLLEEVRKALVEPEIEIAGDIEKLQPASDYVNVRIA